MQTDITHRIYKNSTQIAMDEFARTYEYIPVTPSLEEYIEWAADNMWRQYGWVYRCYVHETTEPKDWTWESLFKEQFKMYVRNAVEGKIQLVRCVKRTMGSGDGTN